MNNYDDNDMTEILDRLVEATQLMTDLTETVKQLVSDMTEALIDILKQTGLWEAPEDLVGEPFPEKAQHNTPYRRSLRGRIYDKRPLRHTCRSFLRGRNRKRQ